MQYELTEGEMVALCYDGKWGRAIEAKVLSLGPRLRDKKERIPYEYVKVCFKPWAVEEVGFVELMCQKDDSGGYGGWLSGKGEAGILRFLGCDGDWYSLIPIQQLRDEDECGWYADNIDKYDRAPCNSEA